MIEYNIKLSIQIYNIHIFMIWLYFYEMFFKGMFNIFYILLNILKA